MEKIPEVRGFGQWDISESGPALDNEVARSMISNSEFLVLLNQAASDRTKLAELLHISPRSYNALKHQQYGVSAATLLFFLQLLTDEQMVEFVRGFTHKSEDK